MNTHPRPPWFLRGPHRQTLAGHFWPGKMIGPPQKRHFVPLADGDTLVVHENIPPNWTPDKPMAVLVHGLTGSHASNTIRRLAIHLFEANIACQRLDMRGAGDGFALARKPYNGGCSDDLEAVLSHISRLYPNSPMGIMGVSLGANVTLRLAGTLGDQALVRYPNWRGLVAMNPPVDLGACCKLLELPKNRIYERTFLKELWEAEIQRRTIHPDLFPLQGTTPRNLRDFDNRVTAPNWGFADADEYYKWGSSLSHLSNIRVPGWVLTARDDPFVDHHPLEALGSRVGSLDIEIHDHGGHMGYLVWNRGFHRWAEPRMVKHLKGFLER